MKLIIFVLSLFISCVAFSVERNADIFDRKNIKSISVVAPVWEGYTHSNGTGVYWEVIREVYEPIGIKVSIKILPWNRARKMVSKFHTYNAIVGEYRDADVDLLFPQFPIDIEHMSLLSKKSSGLTFTDLTSLKGKTVGWIKDYEVIPEGVRDFKLKEFRSLEQGVSFLNQGKIDYLIDVWDEVAGIMKKANLSTEYYNVDEMPEGKEIFTAFSNSNYSKELVKIYNERIIELQKSGKLKQIYKKWNTAEYPEVKIGRAHV